LQPQNIETFYAFQNEVKIAKFKSFDHLPRFFGFSARYANRRFIHKF